MKKLSPNAPCPCGSMQKYIDGEEEAFVSFKAKLSSGDMVEKSRFLKLENRWLYESGVE